MSQSLKNILHKEYHRLKKLMEKIKNNKKQQALPQLVLQPVRNNKYFEGY